MSVAISGAAACSDGKNKTPEASAHGQSSSQDVLQRQHEQLQLPEGAAVATDLHRPVLHHVAQVLQLSAARSALLVSAGTNQSFSRETRTSS